jgi:L,D-transpeptidase catalytic domain
MIGKHSPSQSLDKHLNEFNFQRCQLTIHLHFPYFVYSKHFPAYDIESPMCFRGILILISALLTFIPAFSSAQEPAKPVASAPIDTPPSALKPGEFIWSPELAPSGPLVMVVNITEQRAYLYRNGLRIAVSTVSTGKKGKETPTGVFTILQKNKDHRSSLYNDAPMPFMQRLTWDGVALHAGKLPGYPASHGCVRLPYEFSRLLFDITTFGMTVIVANETSALPGVAHPGVFAPVEFAATNNVPTIPRLSWYENYRWTPEKAPVGPVSILISTTDQRIIVMRNGVEIGRSKIGIVGKEAFGTQAYVMMEGERNEPSKIVPNKNAKNWMSIPMPGYVLNADKAKTPGTLDPAAVKRVAIPVDFARSVYDALTPGSTIVLTDAHVLPRTTGKDMTVITSAAPADEELPPWAEPPVPPVQPSNPPVK